MPIKLPKRNVITLRAKKNHAFLEQAAGSVVTGATLPNGYVVPKAPRGKGWVVRRRSLYLEKIPATPAKTASAWNWGGSNMSPKR